MGPSSLVQSQEDLLISQGHRPTTPVGQLSSQCMARGPERSSVDPVYLREIEPVTMAQEWDCPAPGPVGEVYHRQKIQVTKQSVNTVISTLKI